MESDQKRFQNLSFYENNFDIKNLIDFMDFRLRYVDIHSHLNFPKFKDDLDEVLDRMKESGVGTISVGVDNNTSKEVVDLANENENVWACIGIHPDDSKDEFDESLFEKLVKNPKVVCIGECGLDYFRLSDLGEVDLSNEKDRQKKLFEQQIDFAVSHNLPLMLHVRPSKDTQDAHLDVFEILESHKEQYGEKLRGNSHFFASTKEVAEKYLALNFTISFTGLITYIHDFDEIIKNTPLDKMHIETDAPFVAPVPHRGKRNEPTYVVEVSKRIAELKGVPESELAKHMFQNSSKFFSLGLK